MATTAAAPPPSSAIHEKLNRGPGRIGMLVFGVVLIGGLVFIGTSIARDLGNISLGSSWPYLLLGTALLVALGFEFVNGFHDTANAVATFAARWRRSSRYWAVVARVRTTAGAIGIRRACPAAAAISSAWS